MKINPYVKAYWIPAVLGIPAGLVVFWIGWFRWNVWKGLTDISAGEWLQSIAAFGSVFLTVRATMWLEDRKRREERREEERLLREALLRMRALAFVAREPSPEYENVTRQTSHSQACYDLLVDSKRSVDFARQRFAVRSHELWEALDELDRVFATQAEKTSSGTRTIAQLLNPEIARPIDYQQLVSFAQGIVPEINQALAQLAGA